jgi:hypothetical protein
MIKKRTPRRGREGLKPVIALATSDRFELTPSLHENQINFVMHHFYVPLNTAEKGGAA